MKKPTWLEDLFEVTDEVAWEALEAEREIDYMIRLVRLYEQGNEG